MAHAAIGHDPLEVYLAEVRTIDLLKPHEERALAVRYRDHGDLGAGRLLVTANLRLVVKIAHDYRRAHGNILDLIQEGNVGLLAAVRKFDPSRGIKLSSYAGWWIRAYMLRFVLNNWRLVRIGTTQVQRRLFYNLRKEQARFESMGVSPTTERLADRLGVTERDVEDMDRRMGAAEVSLDAPIIPGDGSRSWTRLDRSTSEQADAEELLVEGELRRALGQNLASFGETLDGRESVIFGSRWMTDSPMTLQQIGDQYGLSRERIRQIERRLMRRLKGHLLRTMPGHFDAVATA